MHPLLVWLLLRARHGLRVAVVTLCVLTFVAGATHSDRLGVALGVLAGRLSGVAFAFGDELADALEG